MRLGRPIDRALLELLAQVPHRVHGKWEPEEHADAYHEQNTCGEIDRGVNQNPRDQMPAQNEVEWRAKDCEKPVENAHQKPSLDLLWPDCFKRLHASFVLSAIVLYCYHSVNPLYRSAELAKKLATTQSEIARIESGEQI